MGHLSQVDDETTYSIELTEQEMRIYARALTACATHVSRKEDSLNAVRTSLEARDELMDKLREAKYNE